VNFFDGGTLWVPVIGWSPNTMNALAYSIVTASAAGLLMGFAMKPGGALADRPIGPQILISGANNRVIDNDGWYADSGLGAYTGQVPEYVLGTDWTQPQTYDVAYADVAPMAEATPVADDEAPASRPDPNPVQTVYVAAPAPMKAHNPSEDGDILAGLHDDDPQVVDVSDNSGDAQTS
jgi:hypothetical protein